MKKKMYVLGVAALVAAMLAMSGVAQSAMWVGAEVGVISRKLLVIPIYLVFPLPLTSTLSPR